MKRTNLEQIFDAINEKAVFFSNLLKTQKMSEEYEKLRNLYVANQKAGILDYAQDVMNSYERLATGKEVPPRKLAMVASCINNYRNFAPFQELTDENFENSEQLLKFLLSFQFQGVDKKRILVYGIPILMLDRLATLVKRYETPGLQLKLFKLCVGGDISPPALMS